MLALGSQCSARQIRAVLSAALSPGDEAKTTECMAQTLCSQLLEALESLDAVLEFDSTSFD